MWYVDYARETDHLSDRDLLRAMFTRSRAAWHRYRDFRQDAYRQQSSTAQYVKTALKLVVDNTDTSQKQLLQQIQNVCIVYAFLAVKRNAGIVSTDAKHAAAARGYEEIAYPGFFRWARDNGVQFRS